MNILFIYLFKKYFCIFFEIYILKNIKYNFFIHFHKIKIFLIHLIHLIISKNVINFINSIYPTCQFVFIIFFILN